MIYNENLYLNLLCDVMKFGPRMKFEDTELQLMKSMLHVMEFLSSVGYKREEDKVIGMKISPAPGALCLLIHYSLIVIVSNAYSFITSEQTELQ